MSKLKKIILSALLLAILVVLSRFISIKTPILVISFSFIPIMLAAILLRSKIFLFNCSFRRFNRCTPIPFWKLFYWLYNRTRTSRSCIWIIFIQQKSRIL